MTNTYLYNGYLHSLPTEKRLYSAFDSILSIQKQTGLDGIYGQNSEMR